MVVPAFGEFGGGDAAVVVGIEPCDPGRALDFVGDNLSVAIAVEELERAGGRGVLGGVERECEYGTGEDGGFHD